MTIKTLEILTGVGLGGFTVGLAIFVLPISGKTAAKLVMMTAFVTAVIQSLVGFDLTGWQAGVMLIIWAAVFIAYIEFAETL